MGRAGRVACIFTPYALSIAALVCIIFVFLGSTKITHPLNDIFFLKVDLKDLTTDSSKLPTSLLPLAEGLQQAEAKGTIHDFYTVGLWNYCYGSVINGDYVVTACTDRKAKFWFDPVEVWGLDASEQSLLPKALQDGLNAYQKAAGFVFIAYAVAFFATIAELVIGISAIFSRWGSFATTLVSTISGFFTIAASATATALYVILDGAINTGLEPLQIKGSLGGRMFAITWLAVVFSMAGGLFWLFSVCCCSGRSPYGHKNRRGKGVFAEKAPYTYERVASPYGGHPVGGPTGPAMPLNPMPAPGPGAGFEPYRHA